MKEYSETQNRRSVLRKLALGLVGVALVPTVATVKEAHALDSYGGAGGKSKRRCGWRRFKASVNYRPRSSKKSYPR